MNYTNLAYSWHKWLVTLGIFGFFSSSAVLPGQSSPPSRGEEQSGGIKEPPLKLADLAHWSFQRPVSHPPPAAGRDFSWCQNPVDQFVLAKLQAASLKPSQPADRPTLLRRVTFDLIGLPPTPDELEDFLTDIRPDAYSRVVDRLLASPHYGEHWAQHWLDVVRYAESNGFESDAERPHAWHYRDYVVESLSADKPYDQFLTEQLAGDLLAGGKEPRDNKTLFVAGGFNRCGPVHLTSGNTDPEVNRQEVLTEMTATVGAAFVGLTVGCARCHNHKFDPISQADYYRLQAFFAAAQPRDLDIWSAEEKAAFDQRSQELNAKIDPLRKKVADLDKPYEILLTQLKRTRLEPKYCDALDVDPKKRTPEQKKLAEQAGTLIKVTWDEIIDALSPEERAKRAAWRAEINALEAQRPPPPAKAWTVTDNDPAPPTYVLKRGDPKRKGPEVGPAFLRVLSVVRGRSSVAEERQTSVSHVGQRTTDNGPRATDKARLNRLDLAHWLTRPDHPLIARVIVNRIWQHHFGQGLVATPNDFGLRGDPPSHPELLDWLACEMVNHGWSIKHMHRLMVLSNTYQQSSRAVADNPGQRADPGNRLLWCMNRRRLEGETLRDNVLAVTGSLNPKMGGPMIRVPLEAEVYDQIFTEGEPDGLWPVTPDPREHTRRSLYLFAKRNVRLPLLEAFDRPDMVTSCPVRPVSTYAPQALIMLNGPFMQGQSKAFASRLIRECGSSLDRQIERAYVLSLGRPPGDNEMRMAREFLQEQADLFQDRLRARKLISFPTDIPGTIDPAAAAALADFCLALLNRNEFVYVK